MKVETGDFVMPGDFLSVSEEFLPGPGAYEDDGSVKSGVPGNVLVDREEKEISVISKSGGPNLLRVGDIVYGEIKDVRGQRALVTIYAKKGVEELKEILERTDILLINESELGILFEDYYKEKLDLSDDKELSFRDLAVNVRNDGIDTVVVKRGSIGAYAINKKDEEVKIPAFECDAVDTTAAGDSFNAGFLYSYLKGYDLAKSCTIANWVASKSVQAIGISGLPTLEELEEFTQSL